MEKRNLLQDEWLMICGGAFLLCGLLSAMNHGLLPQRSPVAPALAPEAVAAPALPAQSSSKRTLISKIPGRWIVDQNAAHDSDTAVMAVAIANAEPGDQIVVRPGIYAEHLEITKSLSIAGESAATPPMILSTGPVTMAVSGAELTLSDLTLGHKPNPGDQLKPAVLVKNGMLFTRKIEIVELDPAGIANSACLVLNHSKLVLQESAISGCTMGVVAGQESTFSIEGSRFTNVLKIGVSASEKSDGTIGHSTFERNHSAIAVGQGGSVNVRDVQITNGNRGIEVGADSVAVLEDSEIADQSSSAVMIDGGTVRVERSKLARNTYGFAVSHKAVLTVNGTKITDSLKTPYHWAKEDKVQFTGGGNVPEPTN